MAIAVWPAHLRHVPVLSGASAAQSYVAPMSSETESGPPLMRPRPGPRATEFAFQSLLWSRAEWAAFERWTRQDLRQGTLTFSMPVFRPDAGMVSRVCQIKDGLWQTDLSVVNRFRVSFTLIIYNW
ncbi:hypothetical protein LJR090_002559 [Bosea sp. LjRoot90]|uniref:hypothetical protein n=1 Tax=Bosea sp. LjRoot90 TaxID=3342342 RepID=UPI003ED09666